MEWVGSSLVQQCLATPQVFTAFLNSAKMYSIFLKELVVERNGLLPDTKTVRQFAFYLADSRRRQETVLTIATK
jgi:hypothetical protein